MFTIYGHWEALESKIKKIKNIETTGYVFKTRLRSQRNVLKNAGVQKGRFLEFLTFSDLEWS